MDRPKNVVLQGGLLKLRARREPVPLRCGPNDDRYPTGRDFSSAMVTTKGKATWRYGRFEIRARLPVQPDTSKGLWPAFWLRPADGGAGELDVLEAIGSGTGGTGGTGGEESRQVHQTIWNDYNSGDHQAFSYVFPTGSPSGGFHTYSVVWRKGSIGWYVDGHRTFLRNRSTTPWLDEAFNRPFYIRLNLAVGGSWPGSPDSATTLPADFAIDYVRVYQWR
jgi:beta-glucanase (GH16 family)